MNKEDIRRIYKQKRRQISGEEKQRLEDGMLENFRNLPIFKNFSIMSYKPIKVQNEFNPEIFEMICSFKNKRSTFIYPKIHKPSNQMVGYITGEDTFFLTNEYGIDEPEGLCIPIKPIDIQVMFLPLVAFDKAGDRVGYGKGYYDKFIKMCSKKLIKIGFSFFDPIEIDDVGVHDEKMNFCITPNKLYEF